VVHSSERPTSDAGAGEPYAGVAEVEAIDRKYLARFTLGNLALEQEVLELFAGHSPAYLASLRAAGTAKAWRNAAHTIKGSAAAVGALRVARLAETAERLDFAAASAPPGRAREEALSALQTAIEETADHIAGLFPAR
jgi:HPt (histidine-containing phosphotransfer) domain-containing protein